MRGDFMAASLATFIRADAAILLLTPLTIALPPW
jgi:hypothetical protein